MCHRYILWSSRVTFMLLNKLLLLLYIYIYIYIYMCVCCVVCLCMCELCVCVSVFCVCVHCVCALCVCVCLCLGVCVCELCVCLESINRFQIKILDAWLRDNFVSLCLCVRVYKKSFTFWHVSCQWIYSLKDTKHNVWRIIHIPYGTMYNDVIIRTFFLCFI